MEILVTGQAAALALRLGLNPLAVVAAACLAALEAVVTILELLLVKQEIRPQLHHRKAMQAAMVAELILVVAVVAQAARAPIFLGPWVAMEGLVPTRTSPEQL